jgi:stage II sporulation protein AA (anti-sigma F factor antagonist)
MPIAVLELDGDLTKVVLSGRIDIAGAHEIDLPMSVVGGSRRAVIVDLAGVEFMASLGLRSLVLAAKAIARRQGRMVLLSPNPDVEEVIRTTGVDELIPIFHEEHLAVAAVKLG